MANLTDINGALEVARHYFDMLSFVDSQCEEFEHAVEGNIREAESELSTLRAQIEALKAERDEALAKIEGLRFFAVTEINCCIVTKQKGRSIEGFKSGIGFIVDLCDGRSHGGRDLSDLAKRATSQERKELLEPTPCQQWYEERAALTTNVLDS